MDTSPARRIGRGTGLVLAGAVGATALTGIAFAQDSDTTAPPQESETRGLHGHGGGVPGTGPLLHGEQVVRTADGSYAEIAVQNGTIVAASATGITVKSEDGYIAQYAIGADTRVRVDRAESTAAQLVVGRPARVVADEAGTAKHIGSTTEDGAAAIQERRGMHRQLREDRSELREQFLQQWRAKKDDAGDA